MAQSQVLAQGDTREFSDGRLSWPGGVADQGAGLMIGQAHRGSAAVVTVAILGAAALAFIAPHDLHRWDFRNNLWAPAHLLTLGRSPYEVWTLVPEPESYAVWMPSIVGALFMLGHLPEAQATSVWLLLILAAAALTIAASAQFRLPPPALLAGSVLMAAVFPPFIGNLALGQFTMCATLLLLMAAHTLHRPLLVGLLLVLASAKPQLVLLPMLGLGIGVWRHGGWRDVWRMGLAALGFALLFTLPLWVGYPAWIEGMEESFGRNARVAWYQPALFTIAPVMLGSVGYILWGVVASAALAGTALLWYRMEPLPAMMWSMALNVLVTPYVWTWDFVMFLPLLVHLFCRPETGQLRIVLAGGYLASSGLMTYLMLAAGHKDGDFWWFPWVTAAYLAGTHTFTRQAGDVDAVGSSAAVARAG